MQNNTPGWFNRRASRITEYLRWAELAKADTGKSVYRQLREISTLGKKGGECGVSDYYWYRLYDDAYLESASSDFLGWRLQQRLSLALNPRNAVLPAWDKCVFLQLSSPAGLPVAPVSACFHPASRLSQDLGLHLKTTGDVARYLRDSSRYPLFAKPAYSQQGYGSAYLAGFDPATDCLSLLDGETIPLETFLKRIDSPVDHRYHRPECGFLFQQPLALAPEILELTEWPAICGVRIVCLNGPDGVQPIRAIWKIAVPPNHVDNFSLGKYGNLLANVDLETGEVSRVINGFWPETRILSSHPVSGKPLVGFRLPGWARVLEACRRGGAIFPLMKIHHWDFAITIDGPKILELNDLGSTEFLQVHGRGLLTDQTRVFLKRHADITAHPWVKAL